MNTITRDRQDPLGRPTSPDGAGSARGARGSQSQTPPTRPATRKLYGCARPGCLEIAKPDAHHCPLHD
jgi:hypothetical protein